MVHEVPLRQKEAYAPPWMQHRLNIHNDIGLWPTCKKETSRHNLSMKAHLDQNVTWIHYYTWVEHISSNLVKISVWFEKGYLTTYISQIFQEHSHT
jgi:hypothetical protein